DTERRVLSTLSCPRLSELFPRYHIRETRGVSAGLLNIGAKAPFRSTNSFIVWLGTKIGPILGRERDINRCRTSAHKTGRGRANRGRCGGRTEKSGRRICHTGGKGSSGTSNACRAKNSQIRGYTSRCQAHTEGIALKLAHT